jgi:hypothetical protein
LITQAIRRVLLDPAGSMRHPTWAGQIRGQRGAFGGDAEPVNLDRLHGAPRNGFVFDAPSADALRGAQERSGIGFQRIAVDPSSPG